MIGQQTRVKEVSNALSDWKAKQSTVRNTLTQQSTAQNMSTPPSPNTRKKNEIMNDTQWHKKIKEMMKRMTQKKSLDILQKSLFKTTWTCKNGENVCVFFLFVTHKHK